MTIRPTKAEYKQYEELKKKIENYEKMKWEMIKRMEGIFEDVKTAIIQDGSVDMEITPVPTSIGVSGVTYKTKIVITVGG